MQQAIKIMLPLIHVTSSSSLFTCLMSMNDVPQMMEQTINKKMAVPLVDSDIRNSATKIDNQPTISNLFSCDSYTKLVIPE